MPTPFYHLHVAEVILGHSNLKSTARAAIFKHFPAFLLGHVAPDVQVMSGQTRLSTHFYNLPVDVDAMPPWQVMQKKHSSLEVGRITDPEQKVFIVGYFCHLQVDWYWSGKIFEPFFGPTAKWQSFSQRLYLHNVLRAYLDLRVLESLNGEVRSGLGKVEPQAWLPFVDEVYLKEWQDFLAEQLKPGASVRTVDVFANRQGVSAEGYHQLIGAEEEMQRQIFDFLPKQRLGEFWEMLIDANLNLLNEYLV